MMMMHFYDDYNDIDDETNCNDNDDTVDGP